MAFPTSRGPALQLINLQRAMLAVQIHQPGPYQASACLQDTNRAEVDQQGLVLDSVLRSLPYLLII